MLRASRLLAAMRREPRRGWTIEDLKQVCRSFGVQSYLPPSGEHYVLSHPWAESMLTVPAAKPIKPIYVLLAVDLVECIVERES